MSSGQAVHAPIRNLIREAKIAQMYSRVSPLSPRQLAFLDAPTEAAHLRLAVMGVLQRRAELRLLGDGKALLTVHVPQPNGGAPFTAFQEAEGDDVHVAERLAATLQPGTAVLVRGTGLVIDNRHGEPRLRLIHCHSISVVAFDAATNPEPNQ